MKAAELVNNWLGSNAERGLSVKQTAWLSDLVVRERIGTTLDNINGVRRQYFSIDDRHFVLCVRKNGSSILRPHTEESK